MTDAPSATRSGSVPAPEQDPEQAPERVDAAECPICGNALGNTPWRLVEMLFGTREAFDYHECGECGCLWIDAVPEDLGRHYPPAYYPSPPATGKLRRPSRLGSEVAARRLFGGHRLRAALARRLVGNNGFDVRAIRPFVQATGLRSFDDPILDVGASPVPERLLQLRQAGFRRLLGIDPMLATDVDHDGVQVRRRSLDELDGRYALIMFHHSFEHVPDPRATLRSASRLLRPGGTILIRTPVMGTWFWETYGTSWWELDPPRHLFVHTRRSIEILAEDAGLGIERVEFDSTYLEILASGQIARGIPWRDPRSCRDRLDEAQFADAVRAARDRVRALNAEGRGGRAAFYLRRPESGGRNESAGMMRPGSPGRRDDLPGPEPGGGRPAAASERSSQSGRPPAAEPSPAPPPPDPFAAVRDPSGPRLVANPSVAHDPGLDGDAALVVLVPDLTSQRMTGGPNTALNLAGRVALRGERVRVVGLTGTSEADEPAVRAHLARLVGRSMDATRLSVENAPQGLRVGRNDVLLATWWPTAHLARAALTLTAAKEFVYLIQDFEPGFYPWSTSYALAAETYRFPIRAIFNESLLREHFASAGMGSGDIDAPDGLATSFEPAVDESLFPFRVRSGPRRLLFYARPKNPRNLFELGLRALRLAIAEEVFESDWTFAAIGDQVPSLELGGGRVLEPIGWQSLAEYARTLGESDVLLSLMLSPHTSYPPLEMAATGGHVVTNVFGVKTRERLEALSPLIHAVEPTPEQLAGALARVAAGGRRPADPDPGLHATWAERLDPVADWLVRAVAEIRSG
jgi:O-antigen biosynthesis protein